MLVVPTWVAKTGNVPSPWVISYHIFHLFILKGWKIDLHPKTSSWPYWPVALSWWSHYSWMLGTSITSPVGTPTPRRGQTTRGVSRKLWCSLPSVPSNTSTSPLWKHPLSHPTSTLQYHMQWRGSLLPLSFCGDVLAPLLLFSFP